MENKTFHALRNHFFISLCWCASIGILIGLVYRLQLPKLQNIILKMIGEHSAILTFHTVGTLALISLGICVAVAGRTDSVMSRTRYILCYKPAEVSLTLAAVFFGLLLGFAIGIIPNENSVRLIGAATLSFTLSAGALLFMIWVSFRGVLLKNEIYARIIAVLVSISGRVKVNSCV
jgi:hypothetical protein